MHIADAPDAPLRTPVSKPGAEANGWPNEVVVTGTPGGRWAGAVAARLQRGAVSVRVDENAWRHLDAGLEGEGNLRWLVFVDGPAHSLAARLEQGDDVDPAAWLGEWHAGAQALARLLQARPDLCVAVDLEEVLAAADSFAGLLADELALGWSAGVPSSSPDPLALAVAGMFLRPNAAETRLHQALLASCRPLPGAAAVQAGAGVTTAVLARYSALRAAAAKLPQAVAERESLQAASGTLREEAAQLLQQLHAAQEELEQVWLQRANLQSEAQRAAGELAELRGQRESAEKLAAANAAQLKEALAARDTQAQQATERAAELQAAQRRIAELEAGLADANESLRGAQAESGQLLAQLHHTQEELERIFLAHKATEDRLAAEQKAASQRAAEFKARLAKEGERLKAVQSDGRQLLAQLHQMQEELEATYSAGKLAEQKLLEARRLQRASDLQIAALTRRRDAFASTAERRLMALQSLREALDAERAKLTALTEAQRRQHLEEQALRAAERRAAIAAGRLVFDEIVAVRQRVQPPHRELTLEIRSLRLRSARADSAEVRLVEHHGRAGLVVFGQDGVPHWLRGWRETGRDRGRPFALMMPGDGAHDGGFGSLDGPDWRALLTISEGIEAFLRSAAATGLDPLWSDVVRRLRGRLHEAESSLRCEQVEVVQAADAGDATDIVLRGVTWGRRDHGALRLRWTAGGEGALAVLPDAWGRYPLLHPSAELDAAAVRGEPLVLAVGSPPRLQRQALSRLVAADRAFLCASLAAMPTALTAAADPASRITPAIRSQIEGLAREANAELAAEPPLLRRLLSLPRGARAGAPA